MAAKILIVDDEKNLLKGLTKSLNCEGYQTEAAFDGETAREKVRKNQFDLIILDIMLPGVDGLTLCGRSCGGSPQGCCPHRLGQGCWDKDCSSGGHLLASGRGKDIQGPGEPG